MADLLKKIANMNTPYLIAEIGINHNSDINIAKKLIDAAYLFNWDCAKFQKRNPNICVPEHQKGIMKDTPWGEMTYLEYKHKIEFGKKEYDYINKYCGQKPIAWTASVWDLDSLEFMLQYDVPFIKIPSAHITNLDLIKKASESGIPLILSTGMSNWEIVDNAVNIIEKSKSKYALLHCNSSYPAPVNQLNLNNIPAMIERYDCPIGYSGHEYDLEPSAVAVVLGATIIERHITIDHNMWGTDHKSSIEIPAMDSLQKRLFNINKMLGSREKNISESEKSIIKKLRF
ncbi:MAG: N-acetylneuraminate synthase [Rhodospirillaceae bacterium]|nr:N-acetylneuraminate synthase [Rhodospirillaceae bacterium]